MTTSGWRLMAAAIAATMLMQGTAAAVVLCKKKNGAAFVRDACKKNSKNKYLAASSLVSLSILKAVVGPSTPRAGST